MENVPPDAEYLDINDFMKINTNNIWEKCNATRTTCSYLVNKQFCEKILSTIIPFEYAIDHELNKQMNIHNINAYWSNIPLVKHGSLNTYRASYLQY